MLIDELINSKQDDHDRNGSNKKCYLFDDYVLLYGSCKEEELKRLIQISNSLEEQGIPVLPTIEYRIVSEPNNLGYTKGYFLQKRAQGTELYNYKMSEDEYKKRLNEVAQMSVQQMDKFISDWSAISDAGLMVDPSKCGNFFYDDGKISFIDLNLASRPQSMEEQFYEVSNVLFGLGLKSKYETDGNDFMKILENVSGSFLKKGMSLDAIKSVAFKYTYFMDKSKIGLVVDNLAKEQSKNNMLTNDLVLHRKTSER